MVSIFTALQINQTLSSFKKTDTGVDASPTLNKREVKTTIAATDGDVIILGGLAEDKKTDATNGLSFLPDFLDATTSEAGRTEILMVLQVTRVDPAVRLSQIGPVY